MAGGEWCPLDGGGYAPKLQADQRGDDSLSQCFDTPLLEALLTLSGKASLEVDIAFDSLSALLVLRLNEVNATGSSGRVTFGVHRLHRPQGIAYVFSPGSRPRLALSTRYWPMVWAEPQDGAVTLWPDSGVLHLPDRPASIVDTPNVFGPPRSAAPIAHTVVSPEIASRHITWNVGRNHHELLMKNQRETVCIDGLTKQIAFIALMLAGSVWVSTHGAQPGITAITSISINHCGWPKAETTSPVEIGNTPLSHLPTTWYTSSR